MKTQLTSSLSIATLTLAFLLPAAAQAKVSEQTLKNLNTAYQGESNAANRYALFAEKAVVDGFPQVAGLFRAAAASEAIHRDEHKKAISKLGGTIATFQLESVAPAATADNLKAAIKGEGYERDTMYPEFLSLAKSDDARPAMRSFKFALATEKEHAALYQDALDKLGQNTVTDYYVCQVCGSTQASLPAKKCPICREGRDEFNKIS